jgi:hypothetical protein
MDIIAPALSGLVRGLAAVALSNAHGAGWTVSSIHWVSGGMGALEFSAKKASTRTTAHVMCHEDNLIRSLEDLK